MIISLVEEWELFPTYKSYDSYEREATRRGLTLLRIPTPPGLPPDPHDSIRAYAMMDVRLSQGSRVYVHCKNGEERSPLFLTGYLLYKGYGIEESLRVVKKLVPKFVVSEEYYTFLSLLHETLYGLEKKR
jgi:protein-tyrosine phosphatase